MRRILPVILMSALSACAPALTNAADRQPSPQEIALAPKQSARIGGTSLSITLEAIVDDSRCPKGVTCVWAGDVAARLRIDSTDSPAHRATLHLNAGEKETTYGDHVVMLIAVVPYPIADQPIDPSAYRATFRVARRP